jgi:hypothetical protein
MLQRRSLIPATGLGPLQLNGMWNEGEVEEDWKDEGGTAQCANTGLDSVALVWCVSARA